MKRFEYEVTKHSASQFMQLVYFCSDQGDCKFAQVPDDQIKILGDILNKRGGDGWELVHVAFGNDGLVAFWKKEIFFDEDI
jgi:hypothetical protein